MSLVDSTYHARSNSNPQKLKASSWSWSVMGYIRPLATFELFKDFNSHLLQKFNSVQFNAFMDDVSVQVEVDRFEFWNGKCLNSGISWDGRETRSTGEFHSHFCRRLSNLFYTSATKRRFVHNLCIARTLSKCSNILPVIGKQGNTRVKYNNKTVLLAF